MADIIKATIVGIVCGSVFAAFKLPVPSPTAVAGIMGIVGIFIGYLLVTKLF